MDVFVNAENRLIQEADPAHYVNRAIQFLLVLSYLAQIIGRLFQFFFTLITKEDCCQTFILKCLLMARAKETGSLIWKV